MSMPGISESRTHFLHTSFDMFVFLYDGSIGYFPVLAQWEMIYEQYLSWAQVTWKALPAECKKSIGFCSFYRYHHEADRSSHKLMGYRHNKNLENLSRRNQKRHSFLFPLLGTTLGLTPVPKTQWGQAQQKSWKPYCSPLY